MDWNVLLALSSCTFTPAIFRVSVTEGLAKVGYDAWSTLIEDILRTGNR